jgi:hypothetical protein
MNTPSINSVKQLTSSQISALISQLEDAMLSEMPLEQKIKLNDLIGKCIDVYASKK